jgi:type IV pilus assembly protein PilE
MTADRFPPNGSEGMTVDYSQGMAIGYFERMIKRIDCRAPLAITVNKAFTLIELLVVVLIIGILAAIALPKYMIAVQKSRFVQYLTFSKAIKQAEQLYYLANGKYTDDFDLLDIEMPKGGIVNGSIISFPNGFTVTLFSKQTVCVKSANLAVSHCNYYNDKRSDCRAQIGDSTGAQICKSLGGVYDHNDGVQDMYYL